MLFGLLVTLFTINCILLVLIILVQKGSSSMGLGNVGGRNVMLFGGSGGQDLLQKITWVLGAIFMIGSLALAIMKTQQVTNSRYLSNYEATIPKNITDYPQDTLPQPAPTTETNPAASSATQE